MDNILFEFTTVFDALKEVPSWVWLTISFVLGSIGTQIIVVIFDSKIEMLVSKLVFRWDKSKTFRGIWLGTYKYESTRTTGIQIAQHFIRIKKIGKSNIMMDSRKIHLGSRIIIRGKIDGNIITGTWKEETSKNRIYYGAIQLAVSPAGKEINGIWVGFDSKGKIQSGDWDFEQLTDKNDKRTRKLFLSEIDKTVRIPESVKLEIKQRQNHLGDRHNE